MNSRDSTRKLVSFPAPDRVSHAIHTPALPHLLAILIGWDNERQQRIIDLQTDQVEALLNKPGNERVLLTDDQRRVLAVKGHALGCKSLLVFVDNAAAHDHAS